MKIEHYYADGRRWEFGGGDSMLRVYSNDGGFRRSWIFSGGYTLEYYTQSPSQFSSMDQILAAHS